MFSTRKSDKIQDQIDFVLKSLYPQLSIGLEWTPAGAGITLDVMLLLHNNINVIWILGFIMLLRS
jgi:hypothetical protein